MRHMNKIAIVLPAYNEEMTVRETIRSFHAAVPSASIWVINNNSTDNTEDYSKSVISEIQVSGGVLNEFNSGKGNALRRAFHEIDADIYVIADADMTYPADMVHDLIAPLLENQADMVVGDRRSGGHYQVENKRAFHEFGNTLVQWMVNKMFRASLSDIMSGYRACSRKFIKNYPVLVGGFEIETDMTLHALDKKFRIVEVPIAYKDRPVGSFSKLNTFSDGAKVVFTIVQIFRHYRPLLFFCGLGLLFGFSGLIAALPVFEDWIRFQYIHHVPLAILATGLEISALLTCAVGLILDSIAMQDKRNFERDLMK